MLLTLLFFIHFSCRDILSQYSLRYFCLKLSLELEAMLRIRRNLQTLLLCAFHGYWGESNGEKRGDSIHIFLTDHALSLLFIHLFIHQYLLNIYDVSRKEGIAKKCSHCPCRTPRKKGMQTGYYNIEWLIWWGGMEYRAAAHEYCRVWGDKSGECLGRSLIWI